MISSSVSRSPSTSASSSAEVRSSVRPAPAVGDHVGVVAGERQGGLDPRGGHVVHALLAVDQEVGQAAQLVAVGGRHAHQLGDHVHRQRPARSAMKSKLPRSTALSR